MKQYLMLQRQNDAQFALRQEQERHLPSNGDADKKPSKPDPVRVFCPDEHCSQPLVFVGKLQALNFVNVHDDLPSGVHFSHFGSNTAFAANKECKFYYPQDTRFEGHESNPDATEIRQMIRQTLDDPNNIAKFERKLSELFGTQKEGYIKNLIKVARAEVTGSSYREVLIDHPELFPPLAALVAKNHFQKMGSGWHGVIFEGQGSQSVDYESIQGKKRTDSVPQVLQLRFSRGLRHTSIGKPVIGHRYPVVVEKYGTTSLPAAKPPTPSNGNQGSPANGSGGGTPPVTTPLSAASDASTPQQFDLFSGKPSPVSPVPLPASEQPVSVHSTVISSQIGQQLRLRL